VTDCGHRYNRYFNRNVTAQRIAVAAFARAIRLHPKYRVSPGNRFSLMTR
jgi:hypothetical protein